MAPELHSTRGREPVASIAPVTAMPAPTTKHADPPSGWQRGLTSVSITTSSSSKMVLIGRKHVFGKKPFGLPMQVCPASFVIVESGSTPPSELHIPVDLAQRLLVHTRPDGHSVS